MLVIRREQVRILEEARLRSFEERLVRYLQERYPHVLWNVQKSALLDWVRRLSEEAAHLRLETEAEVTWFAETKLNHGNNFASRDPKISAILTSPALSGPAKMAGVDAHLYPLID